MDASHPQDEAAAAAPAGTWVTVEEWSGSSASALSRTAVLTASASSLTSRRFGSRWGQIGDRLLCAFVPEGFPGSVTPDYVPFQAYLAGALDVHPCNVVNSSSFMCDWSGGAICHCHRCYFSVVSEGFDRNAWRDFVYLLSGV